ncbi:endonuclease [Plebeiibacterium sediminum]|uniref:Endonuclease n=1 Tax=Plebeiibacterium sediminum TaxID=2992112 RepID=A0AAE3SFL1_9BACT|nr:endonuclease [Plebeiobacterium sediminum]MCW3786303.1 endonuclease [Plebeiobacterium sediminum]
MNKHLLFLALLCLLSINLLNAQIVINEVDSDTPSTDMEEFIELKTSTPNMSLTGYVVVLYNGSNDASYDAIDLDGYTSDINGIFVIGTTGVTPSPDLLFSSSSNAIQNGADAVAIYSGHASEFPNGTAVTSTNLIDAIVYDTNDSDDAGLLAGLGQTTQYNEGENGNKDTESLQRQSNGTFIAATPTTGLLNDGSGETATTITISTDADVYMEGSTINVTFTSSEAVSEDLTINFTLDNDPFTSADYSGTLSVTILNGNTSASTSITIIDDSENEDIETAVISIVNLDTNYEAYNDNYSITINDNDYTTSNYGTPVNPTYGYVLSTAPDEYYSSIDGLKGAALKTAITTLISTNVHAQTYGDVWTILKEADENPENNNEVWLIYTEQGRSKSLQQGSGSGVGRWNREHIYAQSRGGFKDGTSTRSDGKDVYMESSSSDLNHAHGDAFHLRASDSSENSSRSNEDYGEDTGEYNGPDGNAGSWKGDVARSLFYMALRYDDLSLATGNPSNSTVGELGDLNYLLTWDKEDKPDDFEMHRNNVIYTWQNNRNPFIDLPDLVDYVYGDKQDQPYNVSTDVADMHVSKVAIYPNPASDQINLTDLKSGDKVDIYSITGAIVASQLYNNDAINISSLKDGFYFIKVNNIFYGKFLKK